MQGESAEPIPDLEGPMPQRMADAIEAAACRDMYAAAPPELNAGSRVIAGATALLLPPIPVSYFNRVIGLGVHEPASEAVLDALISAFNEAGVSSYWVHLSPAARPAQLAGWLEARGLKLPTRRAWSKFLYGGTLRAPEESAITVRRAQPADASTVAHIVCTAYGMPASFAPWFSALVTRKGWQVFVGEFNGRPVASGALYREGASAWLGIGATLPEYRGRGGQSALLAARISAAGPCRYIATETGEPIGDEPNPSLGNIQRCGFIKIASRLNYAHGG